MLVLVLYICIDSKQIETMNFMETINSELILWSMANKVGSEYFCTPRCRKPSNAQSVL